MRQLASGVVLLFVLARGASADSDSYFCISEGYLAYELREWSAPERRHVLRIIFVGRPEGISDPSTVPLDDFQLHGMKCEPDGIVILSWDKKYTLGPSDQGRPRIRSVEPFQAARIPKDHRADNLSGSRHSRSISIPSGRKERSYQLQIAYRENRTTNGHGAVILHETTSTLIEKDLSGRVLRERVIHNGVAKETVD